MTARQELAELFKLLSAWLSDVHHGREFMVSWGKFDDARHDFIHKYLTKDKP